MLMCGCAGVIAAMGGCYERTVRSGPGGSFGTEGRTVYEPNYRTGDDRDVFDHIGDAIFGDGSEDK